MFLKSLEIQGFKSFAGKTRFDFLDGITGIVGPNGSGKSNVSDAVKWVLGEQSAKQLRGGKMEDVIFAGTQARKPVGFASVSITFDNRDRKLPLEYDEVTVTRKVFRSGESEYRINGNSCRLRDIEELFYDTGIGKEGYSIIGQGRIDKILSGRADERRELFDEAAGIVKYKRRKLRAIKQLAVENDNLLRVSDILSEIESRVGPLKQQADKAKEYLSLKDELKTYDCSAFVLRSDAAKEELKSLEEKLAIAQSDFDKAEAEYESTREEYSRVEEQMERMNEQEESMRIRQEELNESKRQLSADIGILGEQIKSIKSNISMMDEAYARINDNIPEIKKQLDLLKEEKNKHDKEVTDFSKKQNELEKKRSEIRRTGEQIENENEERSRFIMKSIEEQSRLRTDIGQMTFRIESIKKELEEVRQQEGEKKDLRKKHDSEVERARKMLEQALKRVEEAVSEKDLLTQRLHAISEEEAKTAGNLHDCRTQLVKLSSDLNALRAVTERYEGYAESIRRIMDYAKGREENAGILGVVADIIKTQHQYETAIETALGGSLQHIVTKTETDAKNLISFLKKEKCGRATFLPLDAIRPGKSPDSEKLKGEKGFIGIASDLVKADSIYTKLVSQLLGRIVVVDNIDNAIAIAKRNGYTLRIVTLEGESLSPGGSMTGGAYRHAGNLLSRRRRITDAEKNIKETEEKIKYLEEEVRERGIKKEELKKSFDIASEKVVNAGIERNTAGINLKVAEEKSEELHAGSEDEEERLESLEKELSDLEAKLKKAEIELDDKKKHEQDMRDKGDDNRVEAQSVSESLEKVGKEIEELRLSHATSLQRKEYIDEQIQRLESELASGKDELSGVSDRTKGLRGDLEEKEKELEESKIRLEKTGEDLNLLKEQEEKVKEDRAELTSSHKTFFDKREEIAQTISSLDKELFRLNAGKEKLEISIEELADYMWKEYELTYSYALEERDAGLTDINAISKHADDLRTSIRKLGDVNVNAIEEFKETNERYVFLSSQHEDLVKATASLKNIISDLDKGMREQFAEKFKDINKEFSDVFKKLFGGGKGSVELEEGADILDADVSIVAQPPGKKLQNMLQLSGGERALTAIALLFAIQNLKPSPFCLLDEIEAALDDANVGRFAGFLSQLSGNTQYIVITHRRGTMAAADRLYGITMQEKGISTLVSVELKRN